MVPALGLALLAAIEPLGVVAFIAVLGSRGGLRNTRGFIVGWVLGAIVVAFATVFVSGRSRHGDVSAAISSAGLLQIALGVSACAYLVVWHRRDAATLERSDEALVKEDNLAPPGAAMIAAVVQGWPVVAGAVAAVVVVSVSTFAVAHVLAGREPERTAAWLGGLRGWIEAQVTG